MGDFAAALDSYANGVFSLSWDDVSAAFTDGESLDSYNVYENSGNTYGDGFITNSGEITLPMPRTESVTIHADGDQGSSYISNEVQIVTFPTFNSVSGDASAVSWDWTRAVWGDYSGSHNPSLLHIYDPDNYNLASFVLNPGVNCDIIANDFGDVTDLIQALDAGDYNFVIQDEDADSSPTYPLLSNMVQYTVPAATDTTPPSVPQNLQQTDNGDGTFTLTWDDSTDDNVSGIAYYEVYEADEDYGGTADSTPSITISYTDLPDASGGDHAITVTAFDLAGNESAHSSTVTITIPTPDTTPPTAPQNLAIDTTLLESNRTFHLSWDASTDNVGVGSYEVYMDGSDSGNGALSSSTSNTFSVDDFVTRPGDYSLTLVAFDAEGNQSSPSNAVTLTVPSDMFPTPEPPTNAAIDTDGMMMSRVATLSWDASPDDGEGIDHYNVYIDDVQVATPADNTPFQINIDDFHLTVGDHTITVTMVDGNGNESTYSNPVTLTIPESENGTNFNGNLGSFKKKMSNSVALTCGSFTEV